MTKNNEKLLAIIKELESIGYKYVDGFVSNKKDRVRAVHLKCGNERHTRFSLYSKQECRYCKRETTKGKYQKKISEVDKKEIKRLHLKGLTNMEISKVIGFSNSAVRQFLKKNGLKSNKKNALYSTCKNCGKNFIAKHYNRNKSCSKECTLEIIKKNNTKYTKKDIEKVKKYKNEKLTNKDISNLTNVNINKVKEVVKENDLMLTPEDAQKNAYTKKLEKNPNCMREMREKRMDFSTDIFESKVRKIIEELEKEDNKYSRSFLAKKEGLNPKSMSCILKNRGYGHLIGNTQTSAAEQEILEWVRQCYPEAHSTRQIIGPKEIDIYIPSLNLAIEYCGLYWHNENSPQPRGRNYHRDKMLECEKKGIRLITIFEDEWVDRHKQVKNFLKSVMRIHDRRIYARKCQIKEVDKKEARTFLDKNHIQGKTAIKVAFGLYYEDELLGLITGSFHHRKTNQFTLNRLVFDSGVQIPGGASRLLKHLVSYAKQEGYSSIVSWSDNRYSQGNVYEKCGFTLEQELPPDYSYVTPDMIRESKQSNKKKLLLKKGATGTMANTEKELSLTLGYSRIWDCGKKRFIINF